MQVGGLITAKEATRRVLILETPDCVDGHVITQSLFAGLQLILPGEVAPAHHHPSLPCGSSSRGMARPGGEQRDDHRDMPPRIRRWPKPP